MKEDTIIHDTPPFTVNAQVFKLHAQSLHSFGLVSKAKLQTQVT